MSFSMRTNGKLLLTGEYFVTEGAVSLALPTQLGQTLEIQQSDCEGDSQLIWKSYSKEDAIWFEATYTLPGLKLITSDGEKDHVKVARTLKSILKEAKALNPKFLRKIKGTWEAKAVLEFDRQHLSYHCH